MRPVSRNNSKQKRCYRTVLQNIKQRLVEAIRRNGFMSPKKSNLPPSPYYMTQTRTLNYVNILRPILVPVILLSTLFEQCSKLVLRRSESVAGQRTAIYRAGIRTKINLFNRRRVNPERRVPNVFGRMTIVQSQRQIRKNRDR